MTAELQAWNNGKGTDLESWVSCVGNFSLAVGYATIFWPKFVEFDGYILRDGFSEEILRSWELENDRDRRAVERVMNHLHLTDIQHYGCEDLSKDKIQLLGSTLEQIYKAKLNADFPQTSCVVEFYRPENEDDLEQYQITFWQDERPADESA
ncbi:hypothetical protein [Cupriavidus plantarum]|uniref:hypothetical protein n=1 Tax=Cupriavidus plantarum TaxID=942865 RepID=UPI00142DC95A|nr:hypothetical protein [Cupriavidus plantarum]